MQDVCIPDDGLAEPFSQHFGLLVHREDNREGKTVLPGEKTAKLLAEGRRQHRDSALNEIDASSALTSIAIQSSVRLDEVRYISDVNGDFIVPIGVERNGQSIVQIFGSVRVDGEDTLAAQVLPELNFALGNSGKSVMLHTENHKDALTSKA